MFKRIHRRSLSLRRAVVCSLAGAAALAVAPGCKANATDEPKAGAASEKKQELSELTVDQVSEGIAQKTLYVFDNNSKKVFAQGHVPTAKWVNYHDLKAEELPADKAARLVFYCANES